MASEHEFIDYTPYVSSPPEDDFFSEVRDSRKDKGRKLLLIFPACREKKEMFERQMSAVAAQKFKGAHLMFVYCEKDEFYTAHDKELNIIHAKRKFDYGFAGSVYAGQKFALSEGYEYVAWADIDRIPSDADYLEKLFKIAEESEADVVFTKSYLTELKTDKLTIPASKPGTNILYSLVSRRALSSLGLVFLPLYLAGDDLEYDARVRRFAKEKGLKIVETDLETVSTYKYNFYYSLVTGKPPFTTYLLSGLTLEQNFLPDYVPYLSWIVEMFRGVFPDEGKSIQELADSEKFGKMKLGGIMEKYFHREEGGFTKELAAKLWVAYARSEPSLAKDFLKQNGVKTIEASKSKPKWLLELFMRFLGLGSFQKGKMVAVDLNLALSANYFIYFPVFLLLNDVCLLDPIGEKAYLLRRKNPRNVMLVFAGLWISVFAKSVSLFIKKKIFWSSVVEKYRKAFLGYGTRGK